MKHHNRRLFVCYDVSMSRNVVLKSAVKIRVQLWGGETVVVVGWARGKRGYYHNHWPQITNMQQDNNKKVQMTTSYQSIQLCFYKAHQQQGMMHLQNLLNFLKPLCRCRSWSWRWGFSSAEVCPPGFLRFLDSLFPPPSQPQPWKILCNAGAANSLP